MTTITISKTGDSLTRDQLREKLAKDIADFIANGGQIEDCTKVRNLKGEHGRKANGDMIYLTPSHALNASLSSFQ